MALHCTVVVVSLSRSYVTTELAFLQDEESARARVCVLDVEGWKERFILKNPPTAPLPLRKLPSAICSHRVVTVPS